MSNAEAPQVAVASAPANTMLMGEHAVLLGYPALVCALQQRIYVQAKRRTDGLLVIDSQLGHYQAQITSPTPDSRFEFVLHAIGVSHQQVGGLTITIDSDFGHTLGLGSSAAVSVATLAAMALLNQKPLEPLTIMHAAVALVRSVQGRGSGADVAASALGGIVEYTANPISAKSVTLPDHVWQQAPSMCLVYCGYKTPTPKVIEQVAASAAQHPEYFAALYAQMGACVSASMAALAQQDWPQFGAQMNQYQGLMRDLGVSDDAIEQILSLGLQQAPSASEFAGKISGSGLGDCVLLLGTTGISGWPETQMTLSIEPQGVRAEVCLPNHHNRQKKIMSPTHPDAVCAWVDQILVQKKHNAPAAQASAYAPSNIALSKYWGKRETSFNLPITGSLSISLAQHGTRTGLSVIDAPQHEVILNSTKVDAADSFAVKVCKWLDRVLPSDLKLRIDTHNTVPTAAGLASSASGFAALTLATNTLMGWQLPEPQLSALARLGSGSASRSLWHGFAKWQAGELEDGSDSIAFPLTQQWPQLRIGLLTISSQTKAVSSREGMARTIATSALYQQWPQQAQTDLATIEAAITEGDFEVMAATAEHNAMSMHATMAAAWPPLVYWQPESLTQMQKVWQLREQGLPLYLTMDAGPNLKLLYEAKHQADVQAAFPNLQVISPFG